MIEIIDYRLEKKETKRRNLTILFFNAYVALALVMVWLRVFFPFGNYTSYADRVIQFGSHGTVIIVIFFYFLGII